MSRDLQTPGVDPMVVSSARAGSDHSRWWLRAAAAAAFAVGGAASAAAQAAPQIIGGAPVCRACTIERIRVAAIDDSRTESGAIVIGGYVHVNRDSTFLVLAGPAWNELYHVSRTGHTWKRLGRHGEGPGEYRQPMQIIEARDAYLVADARLGRITRLDKRQLSLLGTVPVPGTIAGITPAVFPDGGYVMFGTVPTREGAGLSLHAVTPTGQLAASFLPRERGTPSPRLAPSADSAVWVVHQDYTIQLWSRQGRLLRSYRGPAGWILPRGERAPRRPFSTIQRVWEDPAGRLWIIGVTGRLDPEGMRTDPDPATWTSYVDVLDIRSGRIWARSAVRGIKSIGADGDGPYYMLRRDTADGLIVLEVWTARITTPTDREES